MSSWQTTVLPLIRKRPGMYIGDTRDGSGLLHMLWEVLSNAVDEHLAGHCRHVKVILHADGSVSVTDDGRGIPLDTGEHGQRTAERVVTALHFTPTQDGHYPHAHVASFGVGLAVVNALSDSFALDVRRDGGHWTQRFARGVPLTKFRRHRAARRTGTTVRFRPDPDIFGPTEYAYEPIKQRLTELNAISPGLVFDLRDERRRTASIRSTGGLADLLASERRAPVTDVIRLQASGERCRIDVAAEWNAASDDRIASYVNMQQTRGGGTHVVGLRAGLMDGAARFARPQGVSRRQAHRTVLTGLHAAIHVLVMGDPQYGGPVRDHLADADIGRAVRALVAQAFFDELSRTPAIWRRLDGRGATTSPSAVLLRFPGRRRRR